MANNKARRVQLTETIWDKVEAQAKKLRTSETKVANHLLAEVFSKTNEPIKRGTVLP
jgi:hypothetical protein